MRSSGACVMNGIEFLLDTNFILGMLKVQPEAAVVVSSQGIRVGQCGYSVISRMELLGFAGILEDERGLIEDRLSGLVKLALNEAIEESVIAIRQVRRMKLPDAIILATALVNRLKLVTLDKALDTAWRELAKP